MAALRADLRPATVAVPDPHSLLAFAFNTVILASAGAAASFLVPAS